MESPYELGLVNGEVTLEEGTVVLVGSGKSITLPSGRIFVSVKPSLSVRFEGTGPASTADVIGLIPVWEPSEIELPESELSGSLHIGSDVGGDSSGSAPRFAASGQIRALEAGGGDVDHVIFHVPNFCDFHGRGSRRGSGASFRRLELSAGGWSVVLDAREGIAELLGGLRSDGGYAFTHVGLLRREAGEPFSVTAAEDVLEALHWFLSLVRGLWAPPMLFLGCAADDAVVWRKWASVRSSRWTGPPMWCDRMGWQAAQEAFLGFIREWSEPFTNSAMRSAVGQYVSANTPDPVDVSIIVAQSGLELLGWTEFVEPGLVDKEVWRRHMKAWEKITKLLETKAIQIGIPPETPNLVGLDPSWKTGPQAIAGVRNRLVHPSRKADSSSWPVEVLVDAWRLSVYYLELALLHRLGVTSPIRNRLNPNVWTGTVESPPWAGADSRQP